MKLAVTDRHASINQQTKDFVAKEVVVGRILVRTSIFNDGFFHFGGIILTVTKLQVTYMPFPRYKGEEPKRSRLNHSGIAAICDSREEHDMMMAFEKEKREERRALVDRQRLECVAKFGGGQ